MAVTEHSHSSQNFPAAMGQLLYIIKLKSFHVFTGPYFIATLPLYAILDRSAHKVV